jgi:hypothetical protein
MPKALPKTRFLGDPRPMTREDMAATLKPAYFPKITAERLRDSHHRVARLIASGFRQGEVARKTGYSITRISILCASPAMQELIAKYRARVDRAFEESLDSYYDLASRNMMKAERQIEETLDRAEEANATLPVRDLVAIARDAADRFGYGKTETKVNVNADFAKELEKAIERSGKVIELRPAGPEPFKRRA